MRPTIAGRALPVLLLATLAACKIPYRIDFVPVESRAISGARAEAPEGEEAAGDRIRLRWRVHGLFRDEAGSDPEGERWPRLIVGLRCKNDSKAVFVLEQGSLEVLDDEGRRFTPGGTVAEAVADAVCRPDSTLDIEILFVTEAEIDLDKVASIRIIWSFRLGDRRRRVQTKFFRRSIAVPEGTTATYGSFDPFRVYPP